MTNEEKFKLCIFITLLIISILIFSNSAITGTQSKAVNNMDYYSNNDNNSSTEKNNSNTSRYFNNVSYIDVYDYISVSNNKYGNIDLNYDDD